MHIGVLTCMHTYTPNCYIQLRMLSHMCVSSSRLMPPPHQWGNCAPTRLEPPKTSPPSPSLCFPTQPSIQVSIVTTTFLLLSTPTWLPHAQQVNSPVFQGKPKSPDFQTSAQSCNCFLRYLSAGLGKTLNCHLLQYYHVTQFLLGLDPVLPSATNMS